MRFLKRIFWFVLTNLLVIFTISLITHFFGLTHYLHDQGIDYGQLFAFALVIGFAGATISLLLSKYLAKFFMGVKSVDQNSHYHFLVEKVHQIAQIGGFDSYPEVGVYESEEVNAFATGFSQKHSLVAFSTGLLKKMDSKELDGVIAHELAHIKNGDMVTMTLLQGVINTFVFFLSRVIAYLLVMRDNKKGNYVTFRLVSFGLEMILSFLGVLAICAYSRHREYSADKDAGEMVGNQSMIAALKKLQNLFDYNQKHTTQESLSVQAMKISGRSFLKWLSTHPPLEERIKALESSY